MKLFLRHLPPFVLTLFLFFFVPPLPPPYHNPTLPHLSIILIKTKSAVVLKKYFKKGCAVVKKKIIIVITVVIYFFFIFCFLTLTFYLKPIATFPFCPDSLQDIRKLRGQITIVILTTRLNQAYIVITTQVISFSNTTLRLSQKEIVSRPHCTSRIL